MAQDDAPPSTLERDKAILDFCKHLATLSSAALAFVAAFVRGAANVDLGILRAVIVFLALSLALSVLAAGLSLWFYLGKRVRPSRDDLLSKAFVCILIVSGLSLTAGLVTCAWAAQPTVK
jgi:hypothetical protein